ncbi:MAG TPA: DUF4905 domain-containing protein [Pontibacter sp.]
MWRLRLDPKANFLGLEVRDADLLLADFYTLELAGHELRKLPLPAAKNWWLGLEDVHDGLLLLHGYGNRQVGEHKGIMAYDAVTGVQVWQQTELAFYGITAAGILALDLQQKTLALLQANSGTIAGKEVSLESGAMAIANYSSVRYQTCTYPMLYLEGEPYFMEVAAFLAQQLQVSAICGIEYAETQKHLVISFYTQSADGKIDNNLSVFDLDGRLQLNERIAHRLSGIGSDTFIIFNEKLYFIQDRNTFVVYSLT